MILTLRSFIWEVVQLKEKFSLNWVIFFLSAGHPLPSELPPHVLTETDIVHSYCCKKKSDPLETFIMHTFMPNQNLTEGKIYYSNILHRERILV